MRGVPRWRVAAGVAVLAVLGYLGAHLVPIYWRNLELQQFVETAAQTPEIQNLPEEVLRVQVMAKAQSLGLPVRGDNIRVLQTDAGVRIDVRYIARVDLPLYTVNLHFYPGAGAR
jgi:hypothetical protein